MRLIIFISLLSVCFPQTFSKTFGENLYDQGKSVQQTTDGGYIVTGFLREGYYENIYLLKPKKYGDIQC